MNSSPETYVLRLLDASSRKLKLLQDMLSLTKLQAGTIDDDGIDKLENLISLKQEKIDEIVKIDEAFDAHFRHLKTVLNINSLEELQSPQIKYVKELQAFIAEILAIMGEICEIEKQNNDKTKILLDSLGDEIKKINQSKLMNSAYKATPFQSPSYFIDKKK